jgi:hypothetical protein
MGICGSKVTVRISYAEFIGEERPGETRSLRHAESKARFVTMPEPDVNTLYLTQSQGFKRYGGRPFLGTVVEGQYRFRTYTQVREDAIH